MAELVKQEGNKVEYKVSVPASDVSRAYQQVWTAVSRDVRVPGFRPGKAPRSVIEKRVGAGYIENEVRDRLLEVHYPQSARELKLSLVDAQIDPGALKDGQDFDFTVNGETYPQVTLGDWKGVQLSASAPEITAEVLDQTLSDLQERNASFEPVERPTEASDMVTLQELNDQGAAEAGSYPVYLDVAEEHVREALLGRQAGDEVEIQVPAHQHGDHEHPAHTVRVRVVDVKHKQLQQQDDAFAASLGFESLDKLKSDLRSELERRAASEGESARREELVQALIAGMNVEIPQVLLTNRRDAMLSEIREDLSRQGVKWGEYEKFMQEQGKLDEFMADLDKNAETRVRRDLALEQLAEDMQLSLSDDQFGRALADFAQSNSMTVQQLRTQLGPNGLNNYYATLLRDLALGRAVSELGGDAQASASGPQSTEQSTGQASGEGQPETLPVPQDAPTTEQEPAQPQPETAEPAAQEQPGESLPEGSEQAAEGEQNQ